MFDYGARAHAPQDRGGDLDNAALGNTLAMGLSLNGARLVDVCAHALP